MGVLKRYTISLVIRIGPLYTPSMSKLVAIRLPDELAAMIEKRAKNESMTQTAVIVNGLWSALGPVEVAEGHQRGGKTFHERVSMGAPPNDLKLARETRPKRALGRTPENLSLADNRDSYARPAHAPGCKCLMCQGK